MLRRSIRKIMCQDIKFSLVILYLIFKDNKFCTTNSALLYFLLCSYTELEGFEFAESLKMVLKNQHNLGAKISVIGGDNFSRFLLQIKSFFREYSDFQIT